MGEIRLSGLPHFCADVYTLPMLTHYQLRRWLAWEVVGKELPRKPPRRSSILHPNQPARNGHYRAWIRSLPCEACGTPCRVEAAHTGPHGLGKGLRLFLHPIVR